MSADVKLHPWARTLMANLVALLSNMGHSSRLTVDEDDAAILRERLADLNKALVETGVFPAQPVAAIPEARPAAGMTGDLNAARYEKLRGWMSSNVQEGWGEVEKLAAIACYTDWETFDAELDALPICAVGLMSRSSANGADNLSPAAIPEAGQSVPKLTDAALAVLSERERQITVEGRTPEGDDAYTACELARAAATYAVCSHVEQLQICGELAWPWHPEWFKRTSYRRDLVKAGALVLAEIERLDRDTARIASMSADSGAGGKS